MKIGGTSRLGFISLRKSSQEPSASDRNSAFPSFYVSFSKAPRIRAMPRRLKADVLSPNIHQSIDHHWSVHTYPHENHHIYYPHLSPYEYQSTIIFISNIHLYPLISTYIHLYPLISTYIHLYPHLFWSFNPLLTRQPTTRAAPASPSRRSAHPEWRGWRRATRACWSSTADPWEPQLRQGNLALYVPWQKGGGTRFRQVKSKSYQSLSFLSGDIASRKVPVRECAACLLVKKNALFFFGETFAFKGNSLWDIQLPNF